VPCWTDGEGNCSCQAGRDAGISEGGRHREGAPGCAFGPEKDVGVPLDERRRRALTEYVKGFAKADRPVATLAFVAGWDARGAG
jgi:hypothetical protein